MEPSGEEVLFGERHCLHTTLLTGLRSHTEDVQPNYSFLQSNMSTPLAWHNKIYDEIANYHHRSQITIFESERPWGPWRLVWRDDDAQRTFGLIGPYTPTFPAKFVQKNGDMWLSISGNPGTPGYALNFAKVSFGGK